MAAESRYTITRKIADGGMAEIYLGTQHGAAGFERPIVIKRLRPVFNPDPAFPNMLLDEAHIAMALIHSNIVQVLDLGTHRGRYFLVMELVDGWDLFNLLRRAHALGALMPPELVLYVVAQVCRALAYAHARKQGDNPLNIVHRDISPENILISDQGEVKLTDFGIATAINRRDRTGEGLIRGKLGFMSPEQANGLPVDARSDLYSLGCVLYLATTGIRPFNGKTDLEVLLRQQDAVSLPPQQVKPQLPQAVVDLIDKAMQKDPAARYTSAEEMLLDVERVQRSAFPPVGPTELKQWVTELAQKDGEPSTSKHPGPERVAGREDEALPEGSALVLDGVKSWTSTVRTGEGPGKTLTAMTLPPPNRTEADQTVMDGPPVPEDRWQEQALTVLVGPYGLAVLGFIFLMAALAGAIWGLSGDAPAPSSRKETVAKVAVGEPALSVMAVDAGLPEPSSSSGGVEEDTVDLAMDDSDEDDAEPDGGVGTRQPPARATSGTVAPPRRKDRISVKVESTPPGAAVVVNGKEFGMTPLRIRFKPRLTYELVFNKSGYASATRRVYVSEKSKQAVKVTMAPVPVVPPKKKKASKSWWPF